MRIIDRDIPDGWSIGNGKSGVMTVHSKSKKHVLHRFDEDGVIYTEPMPGAICYYVPHAPAKEWSPLYFKVKVTV